MPDIFQVATGKEAADNWLICWTGQDIAGNHWNVVTNCIPVSELHRYSLGSQEDAELIARLLNEYYQKEDLKNVP